MTVDFCNPEADLKEQVEGALSMPSTYDTVVVRTQLSLVRWHLELTLTMYNVSKLAFYVDRK